MTQRIIKFRAWDRRNKKFLSVPDLDIDTHLGWGGFEVAKGSFQLSIKYQMGYPKEETILMQYTGIHDKNGKEIYEGDIVAMSGGTPHEVKWNEYTAQFALSGQIQINQFKDEIIGNIYENPELLK